MAGDFAITHPHDNNVTVSLVRRKGKTYQQFFAIGGFGKGRAMKPHQAVLVAEGDDPEKSENHLFYGHLFREMPGQDDDETKPREWAMWFNLEDQDIGGSKKFDLHVYYVDRVRKKKVKLDSRLRLTFQLVERHKSTDRGVQVLYPAADPGPFCQDGFTPYGIFTAPDTRIVRADLIDDADASTVLYTDPNPYYTREGFWCASFSGLDTSKKYHARAIGDVNTSNLSDGFNVKAC
jgi:hypothetical protein